MATSHCASIFVALVLFGCSNSSRFPHPGTSQTHLPNRHGIFPDHTPQGYPLHSGWSTHDQSRNFNPYPSEYSEWLQHIFGERGSWMRQEWWRGPNVCSVETNEEGDASNLGPQMQVRNPFGDFTVTTCEDTDEHNTCLTRQHIRNENGQWVTKTTTKSYRCCHGFLRKPGEHGCKESNVQGMMATLKEIGAFKFVDLLNDQGLADVADSKNLTVFCPIDLAINDVTTKKLTDSNEILLKDKPQGVDKRTLLGHMVPNMLNAVDFIDEQVLSTEGEGATLRTNVYQDDQNQNLLTINCARVLSVNIFTKNGIVHTVDRLIVPATKTVADIIISDHQFTILKAVLSHSGLLKTLRQPGQYTVFAPTDDAFNRIDQNYVNQLRHGQACPSSFVKNHLLPNVICSSAIQEGFAVVKNMLNKMLMLQRTDDKIFLRDNDNTGQVVVKDIMGTNGVVHVIDGVMVPEETSNIVASLEERNLTTFLDALEFSDLVNEMETLKNVTVFAPTNEAFQKLPDEKQKWLQDSPDRMRDVMNYHIVDSKLATCDFEDNLKIPSKFNQKPIRININDVFYRSEQHFTAQCAKLVSRDGKACESTIQVIENVMLPPDGNIIDVLALNGSFGVLRRLLRDSGLEDTLTRAEPPYTLFAPTDTAFYSLPEELLRKYLTDREMARQLIMHHTIQGYLCCSGIQQVPWFIRAKLPTIGGSLVELKRTPYNELSFENIRINKCDMVADNGVVHGVDKVLLPQENKHSQHHIPNFPHGSSYNFNPYLVAGRVH